MSAEREIDSERAKKGFEPLSSGLTKCARIHRRAMIVKAIVSVAELIFLLFPPPSQLAPQRINFLSFAYPCVVLPAHSENSIFSACRLKKKRNEFRTCVKFDWRLATASRIRTQFVPCNREYCAPLDDFDGTRTLRASCGICLLFAIVITKFVDSCVLEIIKTVNWGRIIFYGCVRRSKVGNIKQCMCTFQK